jgi:hypothetical protein
MPCHSTIAAGPGRMGRYTNHTSSKEEDSLQSTSDRCSESQSRILRPSSYEPWRTECTDLGARPGRLVSLVAIHLESSPSHSWIVFSVARY